MVVSWWLLLQSAVKGSEVVHSLGDKAVKQARVCLSGLVNGKPFTVERQAGSKYALSLPLLPAVDCCLSACWCLCRACAQPRL